MMRLTLTVFTATLLVLPADVVAQGTPIDSKSLLDRLHSLRDELDLVAVGATVLVDGRAVASAACGKRRQNSSVAVTVDDKWHLGSITKSMTSTVLAKLVERGELSWESPLPDLLPEMAADFDASWNTVTLHHLLTHSAGLPANFSFGVQFVWPDNRENLHEERRAALSSILAQPAASEPGARHVYSNVSYTLAGFIAAEQRNMTWEDLIEQELFVPLKLKSAGFGPPKGKDPFDQPWGHQRALFMRYPMNPEQHADNSPVMGPAGIVHMSMSDLATFGWEHLRGETSATDLLKQETWQKLHAPVIDDYGYGWVNGHRELRGGRTLWHSGSNRSWYSLLTLVPSKNAVLVIVTNDGHMGKVTPAFFEVVDAIVPLLPDAKLQ